MIEKPWLRFDDRGRPFDLAGFLVERDLVAVQLRDEDHAVADRDAAVVPTAADDFAERVGRQVRFVGPEDFAGRRRPSRRRRRRRRRCRSSPCTRAPGPRRRTSRRWRSEPILVTQSPLSSFTFDVLISSSEEKRSLVVPPPLVTQSSPACSPSSSVENFGRHHDAVGGGDGFAFVRFFTARRRFGRRGRAPATTVVVWWCPVKCPRKNPATKATATPMPIALTATAAQNLSPRSFSFTDSTLSKSCTAQ